MKNISLLAVLFITALFSTAYAEITSLTPEPVREPMNMLIFGLGCICIALAVKNRTED